MKALEDISQSFYNDNLSSNIHLTHHVLVHTWYLPNVFSGTAKLLRHSEKKGYSPILIVYNLHEKATYTRLKNR